MCFSFVSGQYFFIVAGSLIAEKRSLNDRNQMVETRGVKMELQWTIFADAIQIFYLIFLMFQVKHSMITKFKKILPFYNGGGTD